MHGKNGPFSNKEKKQIKNEVNMFNFMGNPL